MLDTHVVASSLSFADWLLTLRADALCNGSLARVRAIPDHYLARIYLEHTQPALSAVLAWCDHDLDYLLDRAYFQQMTLRGQLEIQRSLPPRGAVTRYTECRKAA